ncbi:hypothetical protein NEOKW01_1248 [Nematocida sp. AWRm80]|nr:hypothetical protein NEOKW01_1248 [Nematocida sp. AWRm80]
MGPSEIPLGHSSFLADSSSRSLVDLSWLSVTPPEKQEEKHPVYVPEWIISEYHTHSSNTISIQHNNRYYHYQIEKYPSTIEEAQLLLNRMDQLPSESQDTNVTDSIIGNTIVNKSNNIEYNKRDSTLVNRIDGNRPNTQDTTDSCIDISTDSLIDRSYTYSPIEQCILESVGKEDTKYKEYDNYNQMNKIDKDIKPEIDKTEEDYIYKKVSRRILFLWDRKESESKVAKNNSHQSKQTLKKETESKGVSLSEIDTLLAQGSIKHQISLLPLCPQTLVSAISSLKKSLLKKASSQRPTLTLKKQSAPGKVLETVLRTVSGIRAAEVQKLKDKYPSLAAFLRDSPLEVEGVRPNILKRLLYLLSSSDC